MVDLPIKLPFVSHLDELLTICFVVIWIVIIAISPSRKYFWSATILPYIVFILFSGLSIIFSPLGIDNLGAKQWLRYVTYIPVYSLIIGLLRNRKQVEFLRKTIIMSAILPIISGLYQLLYKPINYYAYGIPYEYNRLYGLAGGPYTFAYYLLIILIIIIGELSFRKNHSISMYLIGIFALISLLYTYIRGAWLCFIIAYFLFALFKQKKLFIALPGLVVTYLLDESIHNRISTLSWSKDTSYGRLYLWKLALKNIPDSLPWGNGLGWFNITYNMWPHNEYLRLILETGIISTTSFLFFIYQHILKLIRIYTNKIRDIDEISFTYVVLVVAISIGALGDHVFLQPGVFTYFIIMTALFEANIRLLKNSILEKKK